MLSFLALDRDLWWTPLGNALKYGLVLSAIVAGGAIIRRSRVGYCVLGWFAVVVMPLATISAVASALGAPAVFRHPGHEDIFIYAWLSLALVEFYLFWIPVVTWLVPRPAVPSVAPAAGAAPPARDEGLHARTVAPESGASEGAGRLPARLASAVAAAYVLFVIGTIALSCYGRSRCSLWHGYTAPPTFAVITVGCVAAWALWRQRRWGWWLAVGAAIVQSVRLGLRFAGLGAAPVPVAFWVTCGLLVTLLAVLLAAPTRRACLR